MSDGPENFPASAGGRDGKNPGKVGGCVGTFLHLFDWNPRKRLFATKRLPAERPPAKKVGASSPNARKKYKDERMPVAKLLLLAEEENRGGFPSPKKSSSVSSADRFSEDGGAGRRVPGVVARLMGLESLPDAPVSDDHVSPKMPMEVRPLQELLHSRPEQPVLLSDLLREREYLESQKSSLQDRLQDPAPGYTKKLPESGGHHQPRTHIPPRAGGGYRKSFRQEPHLQPYSDQKYNRNVRPLRRAPVARDFSDPKQLILALSPRASGDGLRPVLLPSKVHNKLMHSPAKSPTKMGSRSARLLEAAVKILEPSMQPGSNRPRVPPSRPASFSRDVERDEATERRENGHEVRRENGLEARRENGHETRRENGHEARTVTLERRTSNAARVLEGHNMSKSWNGREVSRYGGGGLHHGSERRRRNDHGHGGSQTRVASPVRVSHRSRSGSRSMVVPESASMRDQEDIKTVVPQGFEEAYGGGLRPLNVGRRDDSRLDKYDMEDRRVSEKHIVSSLSSVSSVSLGNSPYSECSDKSTVTSFHDSLRRSGSAKEGPVPPTPIVSKSRFMRSKSVREEKGSKQNSKSTGRRGPAKDVRVEQELAQLLHQSPRQAHGEVNDEVHEPVLDKVQDEASFEEIDGSSYPEVHEVIHIDTLESFLDDAFEEDHRGVHEEALKDALERADQEEAERKAQESAYQDLHQFDRGHQQVGRKMDDDLHQQAQDSPRSDLGEPDVSPESRHTEAQIGTIRGGSFHEPEGANAADERIGSSRRSGDILAELLSPRATVLSADESPSGSPQTSSPSQESSPGKDVSRSGGGLLSVSRLFGGRKSGDRKADSKGKTRPKGEASAKKSESSLVKVLLRRKSSTSQSVASSAAAAEKLRKRNSKKSAEAEPTLSREVDAAGDHKSGSYFDMAAVIRANKCEDSEDEVKERVIHPDGGEPKRESPSKTVDDVFPVVPSSLDKGCLRLLDEVDDTGSGRLPIEGFDEVEDDSQDLRDGILTYAAQLVDDLKLDEVFSAVGADIQSAGRNGFSYSPLVELGEPARLSLESYILEGEGGMAEVEKCVSFLGRTGGDVSSPETSFGQPELLLPTEASGGLEEDAPDNDEKTAVMQNDLKEEKEPAAAVDDAKEKIFTELTEARKIVDNAFEEATERVAKKMAANKGRVGLPGVDGGEEAVCATAVGPDDCGQPSPVSVLDCTFEEDESRSSQGNVHESTEAEADDYGEEDEDSLIDDLLYECATAVDSTAKARKERRKVSALNAAAAAAAADGGGGGKTRTEKIVGTVLDISRVRGAEPSLVGSSESGQAEEDYVRKILSVWEASSGSAAMPGAANSALPINPNLFDRVESQGRALAWKLEKERQEDGSVSASDETTLPAPGVRSLKQWQGLWLHRRLLFDCINETLGHSLKAKFPEPWMGVPALRPRPTGTVLVKQVYGEMAGWRDVQTDELDTIIEMDMYRGFGNWSNLNEEVGEIGLEIERTLLRVLIEELVAEIMGVTSVASTTAVDDCESMAGDHLELVGCC